MCRTITSAQAPGAYSQRSAADRGSAAAFAFHRAARPLTGSAGSRPAEPARPAATAQPRETREAYQKRCDRVATWPIRSGFVDAASGLPWAQVARYRVIDEPELGPVPQYVDGARQAAPAAASDQDQRRAELIRASPQWQRFGERFAQLEQDRLTWLPRLLIDSDDELTALRTDLLRIWSDPGMQRLLLKETASGWPPPYRDDGTGSDG